VNRWCRGALRLYPKAWRARYGEELTELIEELCRTGAAPVPIALGVTGSALRERGRVLTHAPLALGLTAAITLGLTAALVLAPSFLQSRAPASVIGSSAGSSGEITSMPVGVPAGPQTSVIACPSNPSWDPPLPTGATVSVSLLGLSGVVAEVAGQRVATVSDCAYSVVYPATPASNDPTADSLSVNP